MLVCPRLRCSLPCYSLVFQPTPAATFLLFASCPCSTVCGGLIMDDTLQPPLSQCTFMPTLPFTVQDETGLHIMSPSSVIGWVRDDLFDTVQEAHWSYHVLYGPPSLADSAVGEGNLHNQPRASTFKSVCIQSAGFNYSRYNRSREMDGNYAREFLSRPLALSLPCSP